MSDQHAENRRLLMPLLEAQADWDGLELQRQLAKLTAEDAVFRLAHPFGEMVGAEAFYGNALSVLAAAWPDLERRDWLVVAGEDDFGANWVGCAGHFCGTFIAPFLDIPPPWLGCFFMKSSISRMTRWLARPRPSSRDCRIRPSPLAGPGMQNSRPSDGAMGHALACIITSGMSQRA